MLPYPNKPPVELGAVILGHVTEQGPTTVGQSLGEIVAGAL